jgi:hypothetical protein
VKEISFTKNLIFPQFGDNVKLLQKYPSSDPSEILARADKAVLQVCLIGFR